MFYWFVYDIETRLFVSAILSTEGSPDGWGGRDDYIWIEVDLETGDQFLADFERAQWELAEEEWAA